MSARRAGQHARETTRRKARLWLLVLATMVAVGLNTVLVGNLSSAGIVVVELLVIAGLVLLDRFAAPVVERWGRGAAGEEHVGRVLEGLEVDGWLTLHDVASAVSWCSRPACLPTTCAATQSSSQPKRRNISTAG